MKTTKKAFLNDLADLMEKHNAKFGYDNDLDNIIVFDADAPTEGTEYGITYDTDEWVVAMWSHPQTTDEIRELALEDE